MTALMISADPLFASVIRAPFNPRILGPQFAALIVGATALAILCRIAACEPQHVDRSQSGRVLGNIEITLVLGGLALLLAVFVGIQLAATLGFGRSDLARQGITYASYARSGYFQLLWIVAITLTVLVVLDALGKQSGRSPVIRILSIAIVALSLAIEASAVHRLSLYSSAYGLTMLRLSCVFGAIFIGALLILAGVWTSAGSHGRRWLAGAMGTSMLLVVFAFGALNPEQFVVNYDVGHQTSAHLDVHYLASLSDDAMPALVAQWPAMPSDDRQVLRQELCDRIRPEPGWAQSNLSSRTVERALSRLCEP